jgi:hypothetical protein
MEFMQTRLLMDKAPSTEYTETRLTDTDLMAYAEELRDELDSFLMGETFHRVTVTHSEDLVQCVVEISGHNGPIEIDDNSVKRGTLTTAKLLADLGKALREQVSQWVYVQRGLRIYDGPRIHIYKTPRKTNWTRTQAIDDAADIVGQLFAATKQSPI